jgi:hypothetical protein
MELMPQVDPILRRIRLHDDLATIEAARCPGCGASIRVDFWPGGQHFQVRCEGRTLHLSELQTTDKPPPWWTERVIEPVESIITRFVDEPRSSA